LSSRYRVSIPQAGLDILKVPDPGAQQVLERIVSIPQAGLDILKDRRGGVFVDREKPFQSRKQD